MQTYKAALFALMTASTLSACVVSGGGLEDALDKTATNSIPPAQQQAAVASPVDQSDQNTVRNAVSSANITGGDAQPIAWANADTGASGAISVIEEHRAGNMICRQFRTSRQRYDGVALYDGEACTKGQGEWTLTKFNEGG
ncbi:RT0821/Lpp0805 family surface protein [Aureimonas psammosilenae]|uniref:RT0821/Lpp0805 family surface protein n=1 Tax=Aureimonas psammosilenae TaxID=2495496 RepID=UPI001260E0B0|nr:RT0821/Lpp0805 family surface protein [Aureimonas psammosilenae]